MATKPAETFIRNAEPTRTSASPQTAAHVTRTSINAAGFLLAVVTALLFASSLLSHPAAFEIQLISAMQNIGLEHATGVFAFVNGITGLYFTIALWAILLFSAGFFRKWGTAIAILILPFAVLMAIFIGGVVTSHGVPGLSPAERLMSLAGLPALPVGNVIGAVLLYGLLFSLFRGIHIPSVRVTLQIASALVILLTGVSQLLIGTLWPVELLIIYAVAGFFLVPLVWISKRVNSVCGDIPVIRAADVSIDESKPHARALTSTVVFNESTVSKIYRPGFLPRAIYWLAFQAEFPYMRNQSALRAAVHRRNLIGMLTEYWYGSNHVARAIGIDRVAGRFAITSEYIDGHEPRDRKAARKFLAGLVERFEAAGLPTWQVDPRQPRAIDNVIETEDGQYHVVDLESGLVAPLASLRTWRRAIKRGIAPLYDDVFFDVTRSYIEQHETAMRHELGDEWVRELRSTLDATESETQAWHDSEPRIWSRLLGRRRHRSDATLARRHWAIQWFEDAIDRWRDEGRITASQALNLQRKVRSRQFVSIMPHFGVHLGTGLLLRFPLGSIARASYTLFNLLHATWRYVRRRTSREEWRDAAGVHSPLVILFSAIPGVGAFSYLASKPIRSDHLLLCIGVDAVLLKFPWRIYQRSGGRRLVTEAPNMLRLASRATNRGIRAAPRFGWSDEHRSGTDPEQQVWTIGNIEGAIVRPIV